MITFMAGCMAGAAMMKYYGQKISCDGEDFEDNDRSDSLLSPEERRRAASLAFNNTSSRSTRINQTSTNYNESADTTTTSHVNFLSDIVARLWPYVNQAGTAMVREMIEPTFKETLPGPLSTLKFTKLDLGHVPLVLDNIIVRELQKIDDAGMAYGKNRDYLQFEWDVTWNSKCDIQLATDKIGGLAAISFGVKGVSLSGRLQVIAKPLSGVLPCMDAVQFAFVNPPKVELDFTGLANLADMKFKIGGINIVDIKGIVRGIVDDILAQSLVLPNRTVAPLVEHVDYRDIFCPAYKGLARVRLHSGRGFQIEKANLPFGKDDIPDVYVKIRLGVEEFFKSGVCKDHCTPTWDPDEEFHDFLYCCGRDQILEIQAWDHDSGTLDKDDRLGIAFVTIGQVLLQSNRNGTFEIQLMKQATRKGKNDKPTGQHITISLEKLPFTTKDISSMQIGPTAKNDDLLSSSGRKKMERKDGARVVGLTTVLISHATNLPFEKEEDANTFVKLWSGTGPNRKEIGATPIIPNSLNPAYQTPFSFPLKASYMMGLNYNSDHRNFTMELFQQNPLDANSQPKSLGEIVIDHTEVKNEVHDEWSLRETRVIGNHKNYNTKLAFTISFAGVSPSLTKRISNNDDAHDAAASMSAIAAGEISENSNEVENMIRVRIVKAYGFETEQKVRFRKADVPDVYCMIKFGSSPATWRTPTIMDSENPKWENETHDYIMESANEVISIDLWDENRKSDDDYYGNARTSVGKVLLNGGSLDVEVKQDGSKKKTKLKKIMGNVGVGGGGGGLRANQTSMFVTVECHKL